MTDRVRQLQTQILIDGKTIPVINWTCHLTSYGNLCNFEAVASIKGMRNAGYQIYEKQNSTPLLECKIILVDNTQGTSQIIFDGIIDEVEGIWEDDILEITGRDFSAVLRDKIETLDKYINMTVSDIVTNIAKANGLQSNIQSTSQIAGVRASTFQGEDWALAASPKPTWHIIQQLADEVGYVAYVDQHKILNFTAPGSGPNQHKYYWKPKNDFQITKDPILKLSILQQSRRCANFTLRVHGYDQDGKETIFCDVVRGDGSGQFLSIPRGDLNSQNYLSIANNLADEITRKNAVVKMLVEGNSDLNINDKLNVFESESDDLLGFSGRDLFIVSIVHQFSMPDFGSSMADGFLTHISCNQLTKPGSI